MSQLAKATRERNQAVRIASQLAERVRELERPTGSCVYCGAPCLGPVCAAHTDLLGQMEAER